VKATQEPPKRVFLPVLLLLTVGFAWLIYRSNSGPQRSTARFAAIGGTASESVGRFFSGLLSRHGGDARSAVRPEDMMELKGIILSRRRPVAMINTTAFEEGETAPMQLASREYSIHCMDIAPDKVRVQADENEPITLQLKERL